METPDVSPTHNSSPPPSQAPIGGMDGAHQSADKSKPSQPAPQKKVPVAAKLEQEIRQLSADLDKAEGDATKKGKKFGKKLIELRALRKKNNQKDWMAYLKQVVKVSYEKARYWINVVEGKNNHRRYHEFGAAPNSSKSGRRSAFEKPLKDWQDAQKRLNDFLVPLKVLHTKGSKGSDMLIEPLEKLADLLGYKLDKR